ncbi:LysR substrate binding domain protein [compost metagenome]
MIQAPRMGMQKYLRRGELVEVLPQFNAPSLGVSLLYARQRHLPLRVRVFMVWLGEVIRSAV